MMTDLDKELAPQDGNIGRKPRKKRAPRRKVVQKTHKPEVMKFESVNPFENCNKFIQFYRNMIRMATGTDANFYRIESSEREYAAEVLDTLKLSGKEGDIKYLRSWMRYYANKYLRGSRTDKAAKTSIKHFHNTFKEYSKKGFGV